MESRSLLKFISQFKIYTAKKSIYFDTYLTTEDLKLVSIFKSKNLVTRIKPIKQTYSKNIKYRIFPNLTLLSNTNARIALFSRNTPHLTISLEGIRLLNYGCGESVLLLETPKGLITHKEALVYGVGGELFAYIYI